MNDTEQRIDVEKVREEMELEMKEFYLNADHFGKSLYSAMAANDINYTPKWLE